MSLPARIWRAILSRIHGSDEPLPSSTDTADPRDLLEFGRTIRCLEWLDRLRKTHEELNRVPEAVRVAAKKERSTTRVFNRALGKLLTEIESRAEDRSFHVLKGGAFLRSETYPPGVRRMGDLDLLVRRRDLGHWDRIFRDLGYEPAPHDDPDSLPDYRRTLTYYGSLRGRELTLDVHWHLLNSNPHRAAGLWDFDLAPVRSASEGMVLAPEHRFIYGALHAFKHRYTYWKSLIDLSMLRRNHSFDDERFDRESQRLRARRLLHLTAVVHETCLATPLDLPGDEPFDPPRSWRVLEAGVAKRAATGRTGLHDLVLPSLKLLDSPGAKIRYLAAFLFPPPRSFPEFSPERNRLLETLRLYGHHYLAILRSLASTLGCRLPGVRS